NKFSKNKKCEKTREAADKLRCANYNIKRSSKSMNWTSSSKEPLDTEAEEALQIDDYKSILKDEAYKASRL
uniref:Uncharacterized protein n=1 Tax=Romanomermis culicivorax TaxID=13658 RepID=A0A915K6B6_ROMCU